MSTNLPIDSSDLQPVIDALTQVANTFQSASDVRSAKVAANDADVAARQAQIDADVADSATQKAAIGLDAQGIAAIQQAIAALLNLANPPVPPTP